MSDLAIAFNRFGLGTRADDSPPADPRQWLAGQLDRFETRPAPIAALPARETLVTELAYYLENNSGDTIPNCPR